MSEIKFRSIEELRSWREYAASVSTIDGIVDARDMAIWADAMLEEERERHIEHSHEPPRQPSRVLPILKGQVGQ